MSPAWWYNEKADFEHILCLHASIMKYHEVPSGCNSHNESLFQFKTKISETYSKHCLHSSSLSYSFSVSVVRGLKVRNINSREKGSQASCYMQVYVL